MFSSLPSLLVPGLPFAYFTPGMKYVSSVVFRNSSAPPGLTKCFFRPDIEEMKRKFEEVKSLGSATAEEWIKGLEDNGKQRVSDAARLEQWEMSGGLQSLNMVHRSSKVSVPLSSVEPTKTPSSIVDSTSGKSTPHARKESTSRGSPIYPLSKSGKHLVTSSVCNL